MVPGGDSSVTLNADGARRRALRCRRPRSRRRLPRGRTPSTGRPYEPAARGAEVLGDKPEQAVAGQLGLRVPGRLDGADDFPHVGAASQRGAAPSRSGPEHDPRVLARPEGLIDQPIRRGRQGHARVGGRERGKSLGDGAVEPHWRRCALAHDYIVVGLVLPSHASCSARPFAQQIRPMNYGAAASLLVPAC